MLPKRSPIDSPLILLSKYERESAANVSEGFFELNQAVEQLQWFPCSMLS